MAVVEASLEVERQSQKTITVDRKTAPVISIKNLLFATDFSATSEAALPYATAICGHFGSTLHLAHVVSDTAALMMTGGIDYVSLGTLYEDAHNEAKERLDQISKHCEGIAHRNYVRHGPVWHNLATIIAESKIDLIVLGTHGRTGLGKLLLGSVAEDILRHAACPVLTVGPNVSGHAKLSASHCWGRGLAPLDLELRQILFATDFAGRPELVARQAISLAEEFRAHLTMMHVIEDYSNLGKLPGPIEDSFRRLQELIPANTALQYRPETLLEFGPAPERILKIASQCESDLIVLGARTTIEVGTTHLPWSTAHQVITQAHSPVLTIRG